MTNSTMPSVAGPDGHIQRLMFLSTARVPSTWTPKYLAEFEKKTRERNLSLGVSGFLLYSAPHFFQVLEGFPQVIGPLFDMIRRSPRHDKCIVLVDVRCTERQFSDWQLRVIHNETAELPVTLSNVLPQIAGAFLSMWRYLPRSAADVLLQGKDPRTQPPQSQDVVVCFIRIVEFPSILTQPLLAEHLADILEVFVDVCAKHTTETGGQFAKFVNGVVMLFWPGQCAAQAYEGLCDMLDSFAELRNRQPINSALSLFYVRAGVHHGRALLCNAGIQKADFTLLGDSVNVASRLCSKATELKAALLLSNAMRQAMGAAGEQLISMGPQHLKGRNEPVECFRSPDGLVDGDAVRQRVEEFLADGGHAVPPRRPVRRYDDLSPSERPGIFKDVLHPHEAAEQEEARPSLLRCCLPWPRRVHNADVDGEESGLISLLYLSRATAWLSPDLEQIRKSGTKRNRAHGITSELICMDGLLMHTVEGPTRSVRELWERLQADSRHKELVVIHLEPIQTRACTRPLDVQVLTGTALEALPILPELLGQMARSFSCLETYLPRAVVRHIRAGKRPSRMPPILVTVVMMATDIVSFTPLSEGCPLTEVWNLCTTFIDLCTEEIHRNRGHVLKLIGDCVKAYFPADAAHLALDAARGITRACDQFRQRVHRLDCRSVMACGVGLDCGPVVMAHCGTQSTAKLLVTGEAASRVMEVEALSRKVGRKIIVTQPVVDRLPADCPLNPLRESPAMDRTKCYALAGADYELECTRVNCAISAFHDACRVVRTAIYPEDGDVETLSLAVTSSCSPRSCWSPNVRT
eukprot:GGOE01031194.1.p1 GENE.GGOE01031194.1~~GGOE01031194.1.p1  ORF type:complete len:818 (+),score=184.24 GGOE01031194.1:36-2456(+)